MATSKTRNARAAGTAAMAAQPTQHTTKNKPTLLAGGNPQIAKADGDAPVQAYIAAIPGWKRELAAPAAAGRVQATGGTLPRHPRARRVRRGADGVVGSAGGRAAGLGRRERAQGTRARASKQREHSRMKTTKSPSKSIEPASGLIDARIEALDDWRGEMLSRLRALIKEALPDVVEEWKWAIPVWSHDGIVCTGETYKKAVKITFAKGASLADPSRLFNASLEGKVRRAIDFHEGDVPDEKALKALFRAAAALNKAAARG
jgi:hypothetical protein